MKVLAVDPGAKRAGWAVLDDEKYLDSGVVEFPRKADEAYQDYRLKLTHFWCGQALDLCKKFKPDVVALEIVPYTGMNNYAQGYLANVMATAFHSVAFICNPEATFYLASATQVKNQIGVKGKANKVTKTNLRNTIIAIFPQLSPRLKGSEIFEETDAIAVALWAYKKH